MSLRTSSSLSPRPSRIPAASHKSHLLRSVEHSAGSKQHHRTSAPDRSAGRRHFRWCAIRPAHCICTRRPTLPSPGSLVTAGLMFTPEMQTLYLEGGQPTLQGRMGKIAAVTPAWKPPTWQHHGGHQPAGRLDTEPASDRPTVGRSTIQRPTPLVAAANLNLPPFAGGAPPCSRAMCACRSVAALPSRNRLHCSKRSRFPCRSWP